ncbi:thioesterase family protein [Mesobacterium sp. TK19101]|uniref:Thioesterase family protein n=1 Tax=Mesobacterium hydrothermale TaxID=3111907 RepID=A0ABU6HK51_9RHOB|nr:thioesterase family protein [Mesobacterium sp. TK19101]MEC3862832.1 thioesterase family protein [Mesobacterium sp. TK19101]
MARTPPQPRSAYRAFRQMQTRWMDNDEYGHMNNATYLSLFDTAVSLWQLENGIEIRGPEATRFLVVETGCRYFSELGFPDVVHAGLRIGHLGTSSFRYEVGLFRNDDDIASTEGFFSQVHVGPDHRPAPIPDPIRAILAPLVIR